MISIQLCKALFFLSRKIINWICIKKMKYPINWYFSKRCIKDMLTCKSVSILLLKKKFNEVLLFIVIIIFFISLFLILDQILNMTFVYIIILNYLLL